MTKIEFMKELENLLLDIPVEERDAALEYYQFYFEDAGEENVGRVIEELGTPSTVAAMIKSDLDDSEGKDYEKVIYTENGYKDLSVEEAKFEVVEGKEENKADHEKTQQKENTAYQEKNYNTFYGNNASEEKERYSSNEYNDRYSRNSNSGSKTFLIILACIFFIPVGIPLITGILGAFIGIILAVLGVFIGVAASAAGLLIAGIVLLIAGIIQLFIVPMNGVLMCGAALITTGVGMLFGILAATICKKVIPAMVNGLINLCRIPFRKRREAV